MSITFAEGTAPLTLEGIGIRASKMGEPAFLTQRRLKALKHYEETPMPGRRDEIWRRVEFGNLDLNAATVRGGSDTPLFELSANSADGVYWNTPEAAMGERPELLEEFWNTQVFPAGSDGPHGIGGKFH